MFAQQKGGWESACHRASRLVEIRQDVYNVNPINVLFIGYDKTV